MPVRLLGFQVANGYSPEARVFAGLLAHAGPNALEPHVFYHAWEENPQSIERFQKDSGALVQPIDFGWRSVSPDRSLRAKMRARLHFLAALPRALVLARRINPDVIYSCQQLWDCQVATYVARKLNKPQVIHLHYIVGPWLHRPVLERLRTCDHVVTVSDFIREEALRHGILPERVTTIRNTMTASPLPEPGMREAVRRELGFAPDSFLVGIIARLDPDKGQSDTLRAFARIVGEHPQARLLIVGSETPWHPGYSDVLKREAGDLGLGESVRFLGYRSDVPRLLAALDVFAHPSRREPFGLAVAEASAAGLPVVGYTDGGLPEIVQEGVTGLLTVPEDLEALARSLARLVEDPELARAQGRAGRLRMASEFQPATAGEAFAGLMRRRCGSAPKRETGKVAGAGRQ